MNRGRALAVALFVVLVLALAWWARSSSLREGAARDATASGASSAAVSSEAATRDAASAVGAFGLPSGFVAPRETVRDERLREQLRAALARVFAAAFDAGSAGRADERRATALLDRDYIRERIRGDFIPMASRCYELLQSRRPGFGGRMIMRFRIIAHEQLGGIVEDVSVEDGARRDGGAPDAARTAFGDAAFETCVRESLSTVAFRPPAQGGQLSVSYPLTLEPDAPDGG
ncbi:MAG: hypothetical protein U0269_29355 [Polyangiales bacterium]